MNTQDLEFRKWPRIPRFFDSEIILSEKMDGTNGILHISDDLKEINAGSRNRWLSHHDDNYGFWNWMDANREELINLLGAGYHYGEWWGQGIQRKYGMEKKVFSLFNTHRWGDLTKDQICNVVPHDGGIVVDKWDHVIEAAERTFLGYSHGANEYGVEFTNPEGYMIFHVRSQQIFKVPTNK